MTWVKICGLTRPADVDLAVELGADACGFVLEPSSQRFLDSEDDLFELTVRVPAGVERVAVFGPLLPRVPWRYFSTAQAVEWPEEPPVEIQKVQVVRMEPGMSVEAIVAAAKGASRLLLDAHAIGSWGGSGHRVDWDLAAEAVSALDIPVTLAGGLTPENVAEAIESVRPFGVDVSGGVEASPRHKDPIKLRDFIEAAKKA